MLDTMSDRLSQATLQPRHHIPRTPTRICSTWIPSSTSCLQPGKQQHLNNPLATHGRIHAGGRSHATFCFEQRIFSSSIQVAPFSYRSSIKCFLGPQEKQPFRVERHGVCISEHCLHFFTRRFHTGQYEHIRCSWSIQKRNAYVAG